MPVEKDPDRIPESIDTHPCGCTISKYPDGALEADMCIPCALSAAGDMLKHVAKKMAQKELVDGK